MVQKMKTPAELKPAHKICLQGFDKLPDSADIPVQVLAALRSVTPVTVWRWSKAKKIPAPRKFGGVTRWNVGEIRLWLAKAA
jgi:predicted DNA-binding transcriptional regulator AlpA